MARFDHAVNSFIAGELSPRMWGRTDLNDVYPQGAEELYNQLVYVQGGTYRRPGSRFLNILDHSTGGYGTAGILSSAATMRLFPLTMSDQSRYIIVITPGIAGGASTNTTDCSQHWAVIDVATGKNVLRDVTLPPDFGNTGTIIGATATGYSFLEMQTLQFAQIGDFLVITCPTKPPVYFYKSVSGSTYQIFGVEGDFVARTVDAIPNSSTNVTSGSTQRYPFLEPNISNARNQGSLQASASNGSANIISSAGIFLPGHAGTQFKLSAAGSTGWFGIQTVIDAHSAVGIALNAPTAAVGIDAGTSWEERAWSNARGWPRAICAFQQRLYFAGTASRPDTVWGSEQGNIFSLLARLFEQDPAFSSAITNDYPFSFTVAATEPNTIQWLSAGKSLFIGTTGREYVVAGSNGSLGPLDIGVSAESAFGSSFIQPIRYDSCLYYVQRSGQAVRELVFNFYENAYKGENIFVRSEHLVKKAAAKHLNFTHPVITQFAVQMNENPIMWAIDSNGGLLSATLNRSNNINAWTYGELGGQYLGNGPVEPPIVLSICSLGSFSGQNDDLYMAVQRSDYRGGTFISIESIGHEFSLESLLNNSNSIDDKPIYMDSARFLRNVLGMTTITGLSNFKGLTVDVVGDGTYLGKITVGTGANSTLTLPGSYQEVIVGFLYKSWIKLLDLNPPSPVGSAIGQSKKINALTMKFYRTVSAKVGNSLTNLETITFDNPGQLNTQDIRKTHFGGFARKTSVYIVQDGPFPMALSCVVAEGAENA